MSARRAAAEAGLGDAAAAAIASPPPPPPPPPPPQPPDDYCNLAGMLTHPDLSGVLLGWITDETRTATALRGVSRGCRDGVAAHRWVDTRTIVWWPARWRVAFPAAVAARVGGDVRAGERANHGLRGADFVHFRGLRWLDMRGCNEVALMFDPDDIDVHLEGIHEVYRSLH